MTQCKEKFEYTFQFLYHTSQFPCMNYTVASKILFYKIQENAILHSKVQV